MRRAGWLFWGVVASVSANVDPLEAQRRELTLLAGSNYTGASGGNVFKSTARQGFLGGVSLRMPRSAKFSFQSEIILIKRNLFGERAPSSEPPLLAGPKSDDARLLYAQIPLLLRFQRGYSTEHPVRPFLVFGPYVGVLLSCKRDVVEADDTRLKSDCSATPTGGGGGTTPFITAVYQDVYIGLMAALGVEIKRFSIGVRGERSIRNLVDPGALPSSPFDNARMWGGAVTVEYLLRVL